jgi:uncharacterized integral membrane protein
MRRAAAVSSEREVAGDRQVYRASGAQLAWWAWVLFAVIILIVLALGRHDHGTAVTAALILAVTGVMYACALWPQITASQAGITVRNPLRVHVLPWAVVTKVTLAQTVQVHYAGAARDRVVHSWAVQSSGRSQVRSQVRARRALRGQQPEPGYARLPEDAATAVRGSAAEFAARQLNERVKAEHQRAGQQPAGHQPAGHQPAGHQPAGHQPAGNQRAGNQRAGRQTAGPGTPAGPAAQTARARWAWGPIAAIVLPLLLLVIVAAI